MQKHEEAIFPSLFLKTIFTIESKTDHQIFFTKKKLNIY